MDNERKIGVIRFDSEFDIRRDKQVRQASLLVNNQMYVYNYNDDDTDEIATQKINECVAKSTAEQ